MKFNGNLLKNTFFVIALMAFFINGSAQHRVKPVRNNKAVHPKKTKVVAKHHVKNAYHTKAINVLKRTNHVIVYARRSVVKNKVYSGDLSKAIYHQKLAKKLMNLKKTNKAMQHSRIAREYAFKSIRANKERVDGTYNFTEEEYEVMGKNISNEELERELKESNPSVIFKDEKISDEDMTDLEVLSTDPSEYKSE